MCCPTAQHPAPINLCFLFLFYRISAHRSRLTTIVKLRHPIYQKCDSSTSKHRPRNIADFDTYNRKLDFRFSDSFLFQRLVSNVASARRWEESRLIHRRRDTPLAHWSYCASSGSACPSWRWRIVVNSQGRHPKCNGPPAQHRADWSIKFPIKMV